MAGSSSWSAMLPELLGEIIRRVEETEDRWPQRRDVVTCACVSKKWREITHDFARSSLNSGKITFPSCLKLVRLLYWFYHFIDFCFVKLGFVFSDLGIDLGESVSFVISFTL